MHILINATWSRILLVLGFFASLSGVAQVSNDLIAERITLELNQPFGSNTVNCRVEKNCINEAQTGKCIKYHNDQWFTIIPQDDMLYYINISGQSCRDLRGVQLVVIDGNPCDTASYQIISCVSLATQDDVFLTLSGLEIGKEHLLNVDGYLHDFCDFIIEFGSMAKGLPMIGERIHTLSYTQEDQFVDLNWEIDLTMETDIVEYQIHKRESKETKHTLMQVLPHEKNAFGVPQLAYSTQDIIQKDGKYYYKVVAVLNSGAPIILDEIDVEVRLKQDLIPQTIEIELDYKKKTPITILIFNAQNNRLLKSRLFNFTDDYKNTSLNINQWIKRNIHFYRIEIIDNSTNRKEVLIFNR